MSFLETKPDMTEIYRQKLLFLLIGNQTLIYHATRWDLRNLKDGNTLPTPKRLSSYERDFTGPDLHAVDAHIELIQELDDDSVESIYREAANAFTENKGPLKPRDFPLNPSQDDLRDRIRKPQLSRIEFALLSLGFLLPKSGQAGIDLFVFENRVQNRIFVNLKDFPLARALIDREEALHSTGQFGSSTSFHRTEKVDTLKAAEWLHQMGYELPKGLLKMARQFHGTRNEPSKSAPDELNPKERSSLLQLIHALAAKRPYQFDASDPRNGAISRIETALADAGLTMSDKTIRKYLRSATDEVERIIEKDQ